jgi:hypothetical protein
MLCYAIICGTDYQLHIHRFKLGNCVLVTNNRSITLNVIIGCIIKCVQKFLPFEMFITIGLKWSNMEGPHA